MKINISKFKKVIILLTIFTFLVLSNITKSIYANQTVQIDSTPLGPVTSKDVIYQIITDRFFDGDPSNNIPSSPTLFDDKNGDGLGDGNDLKLYQGGDFQGIIDKIPYLKQM